MPPQRNSGWLSKLKKSDLYRGTQLGHAHTMIAILGAGAMGCLWAAHLARTHRVVFADARLNAPIERCFTFDACSESEEKPGATIRLQHLPPCELPRTPDLLMVCTKSYDALSALRTVLKESIHPRAILLFQNGLGSQQAILDTYPNQHVYAAVTTEGAYRRRDHIVHAGAGHTLIGAISEPAKQHPLPLLENLGAQALPLTYKADIWPRLWHKLVINCAINPFTALASCLNGHVPGQPLFQEWWPQLRDELHTLLDIAQCPLSRSQLKEMVFDVIEKTASNRSSMLQDVEAGRRTEIDDINGFAASLLAKNGKENTINQLLWERVRALGN